ncbi:hypothetical protein EYS14_18780 [Alteromonadaceae bacterium M269]|nr:hypothetical protein EYS14_18780 [Alteromonadaceae bacterium M269]
MEFTFETDKESYEFCIDVIKTLSHGFGMSENDALTLINKEWRHIGFFNKEHVFHHESAEYFANELFFGHDSYWWLNEKLRSTKGLTPLKQAPLKESI